MLYREHRPAPPLVPWVRCLWELAWPGPPDLPGSPGPPGACEPVLPDGCVELVFHCGAPFRERGADGVLREQGPRLLAGASTRAVWLLPTRGADVLGVRFEPGGAVLLGGPELARWRDAIVPLEALADPALETLGRCLAELPAGPPRRALLEAELLRRLARVRPSPVPAAARALVAAAGPVPSVERVAAAAGLSTRQLERRFRAEVGLGPKELARLGRFQRAARRLSAAPRLPLTAVAHAAGYADQAHFAREFRAFAGLPASAFRRAPHELAASFAAGGP